MTLLYERMGPPDQVIDDPACAGCKIHVYRHITSSEYTDPAATELSTDGQGNVVSTATPGRTHTKVSESKRAYYADPSGIITKVR